MLVRCPSMFEGGKVIENMVQNVDVAPTNMACAGLEKAEQMVGYSFLPLLKGEKVDWRDHIFYEYYWEYEYKETIKQLNAQIYDWLESTDGMNIPLKRTVRPHTDHRNQGHY